MLTDIFSQAELLDDLVKHCLGRSLLDLSYNQQAGVGRQALLLLEQSKSMGKVVRRFIACDAA